MAKNNYLVGLGLDYEGQENEGKFIVTFDSSDEYAHIFNVLDANKNLELDIDSTILSDNESNMIYYDGNHKLDLKAVFDNDTYTLTVSEIR